jgi:hypothetical protein
MEMSCKTCIHKKVCDLWREVECQSARSFFEDECELYDAERKKGKWNPIDVCEVVVACSECNRKFKFQQNYCPHCGTRMVVTE